MKYPFHTESKPVVGQEAKQLLTALKTDSAMTTPAAEAMRKRILARRTAKQSYGQKHVKV